MMLSLIEGFRAALASILAHRFRSVLTSLGIIIGVASVITVVSLIEGLKLSITEQLQGLGSNSLTVRAYTPFSEQLKGKRARLSNEDFELIARRVQGIERITPRFGPFGDFGAVVKHAGKDIFANVVATTRYFQDVSGYYPEKGRFIVQEDNLRRRRVAVIGKDIVEKLELGEEAIGAYVQIREHWFRVVGVLESQGQMFGLSRDNILFVPYQTGLTLLGPYARPDVRFVFTVRDGASVDAVRETVRRLLRKAHQLKQGEADDFKIETPEQLLSTFDAISGTLTAVLGGIVSISLLVGGIGIMNIMLVSVTERTREIGICKALGAQRGDILLQFLIEAVTLSLLGGVVGVVLGYLAGAGLAMVMPGMPSASVPLWAVMVSGLFSIAVGVLFGIMPAIRAANLDPIEALRYE